MSDYIPKDSSERTVPNPVSPVEASEASPTCPASADAPVSSVLQCVNETSSERETSSENEAAPSSPWYPGSAPVALTPATEAESADEPLELKDAWRTDHADTAGQGGGQEPPENIHGASTADANDPADNSDEEKPMTLMEHLGELRTRLLRCLIGTAIGFLLCYGVAEQLFQYLSMPLAEVMPADTRLIYTSVPEGFFVYLKVAVVAGIFLASPYIFYQIWAFIAPGLYKEERRMAIPLALCSALFFIGGATFCYFGVFPFAFTFFMSYSTGMIVAMPSINEYLGFSLKMLIAFGLVFEMPLFAFFLARIGLVTATRLREVRKYAILAVFIVAAILTPPDVFSQLLMVIPMLLLYEVSIWVAVIARNEKKKSAEPESKGEKA